jgi:N-acetylneuraminic acid mutarotase
MWHTAVMDNKNGYMYVCGGLDNSLNNLPLNPGDVWRYNGKGTWTKFTASGSGYGKPRCMHSAVWDSANGRMIIFGGLYYSTSGSPHYFNDAYEATFNSTLNQVTWKAFSFTTTPPSIHGMAAGWDATSTTDRMVFHGGLSSTAYYSSTYSFVPSSPSLGTISTSSDPSARYRSIFCTDASNGLYIFGGDTGKACLQDTYLFNFSTNKWTTISGGTNKPGVRCSGAGAWDSGNSRFILFGGYDVHGTSTPLLDLHELR